jgi:hypothetical protein
MWLLIAIGGIAGFVSASLTIAGVIGWVKAMLGLLFLLLALMLWVTWVRLRALLREHAAAREHIANLTAQLPDTALHEMVEKLKLLEQERHAYEDALFRITIRSRRALTESIAIRYRIGETPIGDRTTLSFDTTAEDPDHPVRWTLVRAWADGRGAAQLSAFRELLDLEAFEQWPDGRSPTRIPILDLGRHDRYLLGLVLFSSEITGDRQWEWSYTWPGMWTPLRDHNSDWSEYDTRPLYNVLSRTSQVTVSFVFPAQAREPRVESVSGTPPCLPEPQRDPLTGGRVFRCAVPEPEPTLLHWNLRVSGWDWGAPAAMETRTQVVPAR